MDKLFERAWALQIIPPSPDAAQTSRLATVFSSSGGFPLRFMFTCERSLMSEPNKGKFVLTNLKVATASAIVPGTLVVLSAGYVSNLALIYKGEVAKVETTKDGGDTNVLVECGDGEPFIAYSHVNLSYKGKVTLAQVLQDICRQMNVSIGGQVYSKKGVIIQGLPNKSYKNLSISSLLREALDTLLHPCGLSWSIQSGILIVQNAEGILSLRSVVLTPKSGLVGIVSKTPMGMSCSTLMIPYISPGNAVTIASAGDALNGNYRVVKATYKGDTMGQDWGIDIEAQNLVNPLAPAPVATKDTDVSQGVELDADEDADNLDEAAQ